MFGFTSTEMKAAVSEHARQVLRLHPAEQIAQIGWVVHIILGDYRRDHPEQVPTTLSGGGLLGLTNPRPVDDFELAKHLVEIKHERMVKLQLLAGGMSILIAYLAVVSLPNGPLPAVDWFRALRYAMFEGGVENTVQVIQLQAEVEKLGVDAAHGKLFKTGRKVGGLSPVALKVKKYLVQHPTAKTVEVWTALKKTPPKGHDFRESDKLGRYIEVGAKTVMEWPRFRNLVSEHRPKK